MKNQHIFKLIDGDFSTRESREILQNIFSSKIQFHQIKNFSSQERFGKEDKNALKRIPELRKSVEKILKIIESAEMKGKQLEIKSDIVISLIRPIKNV